MYHKNFMLLVPIFFALSGDVHAGKPMPMTDSYLQLLAQRSLVDVPYNQTEGLEPNFRSFHYAHKSSWWRSMWQWWNRSGPPSLSSLESDLSLYVQQQLERQRRAPYALIRGVDQQSRVILVNNIQGSAATLVSCIADWKLQGILKDDLTVQDNRTLIIISGTVLARSPAIIETLCVLLALLVRNPDNIIYVPAIFELEGLWEGKGLADQVQIQYGSGQGGGLYRALHKFYDCLPTIVYLQLSTDKQNMIAISADVGLIEKSRERFMGPAFAQVSKNQWVQWSLLKSEPQDDHRYVRVYFNAQDIHPSVYALKNLEFMAPIGVTGTWRLWSSAYGIFEKLYQMSHEAYAVITFGLTTTDSVISLYTKRSHSNDYRMRFMLSGMYDLDSGRKLATQEGAHAQGYDINNIRIGSTLDLSKSNKNMGQAIERGMLAAVNQCNQALGVHNQEVHAIILDDGYVPGKARENVSQLQHYFDTSLVVLPVGTPTLTAVKDQLYTTSLLIAFPVTGAEAFRKPDLKAIIHYRPSYTTEATALIAYLVQEKGLKSFAFWYQDDAYGQGVMQSVRELLPLYGIKNWVELPYARTGTNFTIQVKKLQDHPVEALGLFSSSGATQEFLRQAGAQMLASLQLFGISFLSDAAFEQFVHKDMGLSYIVSRLVPDMYLSQIPLVQEYRAAMDLADQPYDPFSLEAYLCTSLLLDRMKACPKGQATPAALIKQFESLQDFNFKGLPLSFDVKTRQLSRTVWIDLFDGKPWKEVNFVPLLPS